MGARPGRTSGDENASRPQRPSIAPSASAPAGEIPRLPLRDTSLYAETYIPAAAVATSFTSLVELAHLIRLQRHQEQKRHRLRVRLYRWLISCGLLSRLARCGELARKTLVDSYRSDDKKSFATLYNAVCNVRDSCVATQRYAVLDEDLEAGRADVQRNEKTRSPFNFLQELNPRTRHDLLSFISKIRTSSDFLAGRIASLTSSELASLTAFHQSLDPIDSVMPLQSRGRIFGSSASRNVAHVPSPVERLLSFHRHDPLSALIFSVFASPSGYDSPEDLRRTDVWSTTCAKLITDGKGGSESFICTVLSTWASLREWPAKGILEMYLMKILQDGAFLLENIDDRPIGSRLHGQSRSIKDTIAADDFYDKAVKELFEVIDGDPSAGGIPEGVLEIGTAILRKLDDPKKQRAALNFIVSRWFFSKFLLNAIIHPEAHGIMTCYHISEYARQKILKEVAIRAQKQVLDMNHHWRQAIPTLPKIRVHIESIFSRFRSLRKQGSKPFLPAAKVISSPRETVEVQPFLVICPADLVILVNALFPERRPLSSSLERDLQRKGLRSAASSFSGFSLPIQTKSSSKSGLDSGSILSNSSSSMTSDTTSREPLLDTAGTSMEHILSLPSLGCKASLDDVQKGGSIEEYGQSLRAAVSEMSRVLGVEATAGSCHPCAEKWAILYISADGNDVTTRAQKDWEDDEDDEDSPDTESEDDDTTNKNDLERDYHQVKDAIYKLVEEYEIPKELIPESDSKVFTNRTQKAWKGSENQIASHTSLTFNAEAPPSRNPYHNQAPLSSAVAKHKQAVPERYRPVQHDRSLSLSESGTHDQQPSSTLLIMLESAMSQCHAQSDFIAAHLYWKTLQQLRRLSSSSLARNGYGPLLNYFSRGPRDSLGKCASSIEGSEAWFVWLKHAQERHDSITHEMMQQMKELRDKMWYITDVKNSARYEEARNVVIALKGMVQTSQLSHTKAGTTAKTRHPTKQSTNNFLLKSEAQLMDLMTASIDQGGPNKLSDEQAEKTLKWLTQYGIENFCKGEERIHRFCVEIDNCVTKLVGDGILAGPVLWSSELYTRDKRILEGLHHQGDCSLMGVGNLNSARRDSHEPDVGRPGSRKVDIAARASNRDLRFVSLRNVSQQSFDSDRWSIARGSETADFVDSSDLFGTASPVLSIDSSTTFWSPFQTEAASPTSASSIRPMTGSSTNETVIQLSENLNLGKNKFLSELKQALTGLLLSDLGSLIWGGGSETDAWFSGELGKECFQRKENEVRKRRKALAKKKSIRNMKSNQSDYRSGPLDTLGRTERSQPAAPVATLEHVPLEPLSHEENSSSSDATARSLGTLTAKNVSAPEYPYNVAFRQLLSKFSTHPNPYIKLHALYELEVLIIASLTARPGRSSRIRRDTLPAVPTSPTLGSIGEPSSREVSVQVGRAKNLEETIASCAERRLHTIACGNTPSPFKSPKTQATSKAPSTDMIIDVLQKLFRDANIRPKTLFRDLQYIASFVPAPILDKTDRGKAFWDAGLAALGLKQDVCRVMVEIADDIVKYHTDNRGQSTARRAGGSDELARFSMEDAARMWTITAKEGDPVAERELAIFHLTHPDLVQRTTFPLTMPKDTFKAEMMYRRNEDPTRSDPYTMCVALHWMELSSQGGDKLARKYLRAREELNAIP
ncbi:MAG: hypothetical protein M1835_005551 [Candelina submexicana]|nr:MAG: hypothetical protein M1835_005551 [Candelina submexicana]